MTKPQVSPTVAASAHGTANAVLLEHFPEVLAGGLTAAVGMGHQAGLRCPRSTIRPWAIFIFKNDRASYCAVIRCAELSQKMTRFLIANSLQPSCKVCAEPLPTQLLGWALAKCGRDSIQRSGWRGYLSLRINRPLQSNSNYGRKSPKHVRFRSLLQAM